MLDKSADMELVELILKQGLIKNRTDTIRIFWFQSCSTTFERSHENESQFQIDYPIIIEFFEKHRRKAKFFYLKDKIKKLDKNRKLLG